MRAGLTVRCAAALLAFLPAAAMADRWEGPRRGMLDEIRADVAQTSRDIGRVSLEPRVMESLGKVPRHEFVPADLLPYAYENRPLPIGYGQTISQPYIVALMTDLLGLAPGHAVLEVGTGSGYQAAVLSELGARVYTMEIIPELAASARERLARLGYRNVEVRHGDGYYGWPEHAPFDAIMVTAAGSHIPQPLVKQLKPGGKLVVPVGPPFLVQQLMLVEKAADGSVSVRQILPVSFVPLTGGH